MHKILTPKDLIKMQEALGLTNIKTAYAGLFSLAVTPWDKSNFWMFKRDSIPGYITLGTLNQLNKLSSWFFKKLPDMPTSLLSPYVISIYKKSQFEKI